MDTVPLKGFQTFMGILGSRGFEKGEGSSDIVRKRSGALEVIVPDVNSSGLP